MKTYKLLPFIIIFLLSACATTNNQENTYGQLGKWYSFEMRGSYVQWNKNYAVTAKHVENSSYPISYVSKTLDLKFIELKSESVPVWNNHIPREKVSMKGFPSFFEEEVIGNISGPTITFMGSQSYQLVNGKVIKGMSGGPVFNEKREVIGIIIGYTTLTDGNGTEEFQSLFLPYSEIKKEWDNLQKI